MKKDSLHDMIFRIRNMGTAKTVSEVKIMPLTKMEAENFTVFINPVL